MNEPPTSPFHKQTLIKFSTKAKLIPLLVFSLFTIRGLCFRTGGVPFFLAVVERAPEIC